LSIGKLVAGQERYYEQQVALGRDDYYAGSGEAPGRWLGTGAQALGLEGEADGDAFGALIAGRDPTTGEPLRAASGRDRVVALDPTFSAPKSVSVRRGMAWPIGSASRRQSAFPSLTAYVAQISAMVASLTRASWSGSSSNEWRWSPPAQTTSS
jgi:conjugative relaxase-like TrwC/TraI family protein